MEKVSKIQIGCEKYSIQDSEARQLIQELRDSDILSDIDINATVDSNTGTPNVHVNKGENTFTLNFTGLKGETGPRGELGPRGDRGEVGQPGNDGRDGRDGLDGIDGKNGITPHLMATASIGNTVGTPNVEVTRSGSDENPVFNFYFNGLRGKDGIDGQDGRDGKDGADGDGSTYDDSEIRNRILAIERDIINKWNQINQKVKDNVDDIINDSEWLDLLSDKIQSESNFGEADVDLYLQRIGLYTKNGDTRTWAWSTIQQEINNIWIAVRAILSGVDPTDLTALEASLKSYIDTQTQTAVNSLSAQYARKDAEKILEWMYSELDQGASPEQTWNDLVSAAGGNGSGAIANVATNIKKLAENKYLAKANLVSAIVEDASDITEEYLTAALASAGVITSADLNNANSTLYSKLGQKYAAVDTVVTKDSNGKIQSGVTINADQINLQGHVWADDINASSIMVSQGLSTLSGGNVSVTSSGIALGSTSSGTSRISASGINIGGMQYSADGNILQVGSIKTTSADSNILTNKIRSINGDSANILLSSSENGHGGTIIVNGEAAISLVSPNVICSGGKLTLSANGENVELTASTLKRLILMLENL